MRILDLTAGNRGIWFNKSHPFATFIDIRPTVKPDVVADARQLKELRNGPKFDLVVFDPPHLNFGKNSNMSKCYGHHTTAEILELIQEASLAAWAVTNSSALMALKWNDHSISLKRVLALMPNWEPLFGHGVSESHRRNKATSWVMLRRIGIQEKYKHEADHTVAALAVLVAAHECRHCGVCLPWCKCPADGSED